MELEKRKPLFLQDIMDRVFDAINTNESNIISVVIMTHLFKHQIISECLITVLKNISEERYRECSKKAISIFSKASINILEEEYNLSHGIETAPRRSSGIFESIGQAASKVFTKLGLQH